MVANLLNAQTGFDILRDYLHIERLWDRGVVSDLDSHLTEDEKGRILQIYNEIDNPKIGLNVEIESSEFMTLRDFYILALDSASGEAQRVLGHKTTVSHRVLEPLLEAIPELKVLYMLRDPRDVVVSAGEIFEWEDSSNIIRSWTESFAELERLCQKRRLKDRIQVVRFEDLVLKSDSTLKEMSRFLEEEIVLPSELQDYGNGWQDNSSFGDVTCLLDSTPVGRWKRLNMELGKRVESCLAEQLVKAGYHLS